MCVCIPPSCRSSPFSNPAGQSKMLGLNFDHTAYAGHRHCLHPHNTHLRACLSACVMCAPTNDAQQLGLTRPRLLGVSDGAAVMTFCVRLRGSWGAPCLGRSTTSTPAPPGWTRVSRRQPGVASCRHGDDGTPYPGAGPRNCLNS